MTMRQHVTLTAALRIGFSLIWLLVAALVFVGVVGGGLLSGDSQAIRITSIVGTALAVVFGLLAVPGVIGGIGLLKYQNWARILCLVLSILDLTAVPVGTLIGVYSIWVLAQRETEALFGCCGATPTAE
jgi:hypothetical protein